MSLQSFVAGFSFFKPQNEDDAVDRLNYQYTSSAIMVFATLVSFKIFAGRPMECWVPAEYRGGWEAYAEMFCWARNTYFVPFDEDIPENIEVREANQVSYYQWTPFFLLICAFAFYFPCILWRILNDKSGVRLRDIIEVAQDPRNIQPEDRLANVKGLAAHLQSIFRHQYHFGSARNRATHKFARCFNVRYYEAYMTVLYLGIKVLYLVNVIAQLFLMNKFLQTDDYSIYGFGVLKDLLQGRSWEESGNFPRVTMCDMQIRVLGNVQRHTVQCVLVINIFTEKLFILLWMWYCLLSVLTLLSLFYWLWVSIFPSQRHNFIVRRLELADMNFDSCDYKTDLHTFVQDWVKTDGVFVLRMITMHTGGLFTMEIVDAMWDAFLEENVKAIVLESALPGECTSLHKIEEEDDVPPLTAVRPPFKRKNSVFKPLIIDNAGERLLSVGRESPSSPGLYPQTQPQSARPAHNRAFFRASSVMQEPDST